jgi:hypothetical protein
MEAQMEEEKKEEEKVSKKLRAGKAGAELSGEPASADGLLKAKSEDAAESHINSGKGDKPDKKSKKDKESLY